MLKTITAFAAVLAASALVLPTVSHAEAPTSKVVSYADLDLLSPGGQKVLFRRIGHAAEAVCEVGYTRELARELAATECRTVAVSAAQPAYEAAIDSYRRGTVTVGAASLIVTAR
jgi:UrcA family protein